MFVKMSEATVKRVNVVSETWQGNEHIARPAASQVDQLMESAMAFTVKRSSEKKANVISKMQKNDEWMNSTWRYALAKAIADSLRSNQYFVNLHITGSVVNDRSRLTSDINLILHASEDQETFESWIAVLDEELTKRFRTELGLGEGFLSLLDCHVITNDDVNKRAGYAALLSSPHSNVICL